MDTSANNHSVMAQPLSEEIILVTDVYGARHRLKKADLVGHKIQIPLYTKTGRKNGKTIHRDNIDQTGHIAQKFRREIASNPLFDVIYPVTRPSFQSASAAKAYATTFGYASTHSVVVASQLSTGLTGFLLKRNAN